MSNGFSTLAPIYTGVEIHRCKDDCIKINDIILRDDKYMDSLMIDIIKGVVTGTSFAATTRKDFEVIPKPTSLWMSLSKPTIWVSAWSWIIFFKQYDLLLLQNHNVHVLAWIWMALTFYY